MHKQNDAPEEDTDTQTFGCRKSLQDDAGKRLGEQVAEIEDAAQP
jgi:hypothetical protein